MIPPSFDYADPTSVNDAVGLLAQHGADARILAGGQSLLVLLKQRKIAPKLVVDISGVQDLRGIDSADGNLKIGAMTTQAELLDSGKLGQWFGQSGLMPSLFGDPMIRNCGTFGGALAYADPAADWPAIALALDATIHGQGPNGSLAIPIEQFFIDAFKTSLQPDQLLTQVTIPKPNGQTWMVYRKHRHPASQQALVGVAVRLDGDTNGKCQDCRVAITGAGRHPYRAKAVESALHGQQLSDDLIARAAKQATNGIDLQRDLFGDQEYRALLATTYVKRALMDAYHGADQGRTRAA